MADTFTPPADVAHKARLALDVRATKPPSQQGMTPVGLARANQLANLLDRYDCDEFYYTHEIPHCWLNVKQHLLIPYNFYPTIPTPHPYYANKQPETEPCNV